MKQRFEPLACRIHDAVVVSGTDEEQEMCFDWYQKQAVQEPCPACTAIAKILADHERTNNRRKLRALWFGAWTGFIIFMVNLCFYSPISERWITIGALLIIGVAGLLAFAFDIFTIEP